MTQTESTNDLERDTRHDRLTFYPVVVMATVFCITIFMVIAATFGDPEHPVNGFINRNANTVFIVEAILLVVSSIVAMTIDRVRTLKRLSKQYESLSGQPRRSDARNDQKADSNVG